MERFSRKKPQPRPPKKKSPESLDIRKLFEERNAKNEAEFSQAYVRLRSLLVQFAVEDVLVALNVVDLWPPNISSQAKHLLAFATCLSISPGAFATARIDTYEKFEEFAHALIEALPGFHSLEDYWPTEDWGEIKFTDGIDARPSFYGGSVQRIPDFIESLRILYGDASAAMTDMRHARRMQAAVLEKVQRPTETSPEDAGTGHMEVPARWFWESLSAALPIAAAPACTPGLLAAPGAATKWRTAREFGDAVMSGEVVPWVGVQLARTFLPLSLRNAPAAVLDFWSRNAKVEIALASERFTEFMAKRINDPAFLQGPVHVVSQQGRSAHALAAVLPSQDKHYLVVFCGADELPHINRPIAEIKRLVREGSDWGFIKRGSFEGVQLRDHEGRLAPVDRLDVIVVVGYVTTKLLRLRVPKNNNHRVLSILDAVTLFDAMKDVDELTRFWSYEASLRLMGGGGMSDLADLFGSFRDSHGQIIDGAIVPNMIMLDPHWGANWRYAQLQDYWSAAPRNFPDDDSAWDTKELNGTSSLRRATARNAPRLAWSGQWGGCTLHFVLDVYRVGLSVEDGRVLETFIHCAADCLAEREVLALSIAALPYRRVVVDCLARPGSLTTLSEDEAQLAVQEPLVLDWQVQEDRRPDEMRVRLVVNLARVQSRLQQVEDASFEAECATALIDMLARHVRGRPIESGERDALAQTANRQPRFVMRAFKRTVDVPDFGEPHKPTPENFKVARRKLAELLLAQGVAPGRYELGDAKTVINAARAAYRDMVHERLRGFDRDSLIRYCAVQLDTASADYEQQALRHRHSLAHEVDYDRDQAQADGHEQFTRNSRNWMYAVEAALFLTEPRTAPTTTADVLEVIAMIDWLFVLYQASDVLHNEIEVGGLAVDDQYVPEVFFSERRGAQQDEFAREMAALRLGKGVADEDKLERPFADGKFLPALDAAWLDDLGFRYRDLLKVLSTMINWVGIGASMQLAFGYAATVGEITKAGLGAHDDLDEAAARRAIEFLILKPAGIRRLAGGDEDTDDVPVWEHTKRVERYTIKPLVQLTDGRLFWGASMADRAKRIWTGSISSGYLPADYPWPAVRKVVAKAKKDLEDGLEDVAYAVCARATPYAMKGLDFKDRFPKQGFEDVGDFDVLAYWPQGNRWLLGECKYNQPPFCLKDARRLRDRVFGSGRELGQFVKIERRRKFFADHVDLIRQLLRWPEPTDAQPEVTEIYICKDLHWWLRFPPYEVPTKFSQIDTLGAWLAANGFAAPNDAMPNALGAREPRRRRQTPE